MDRADVKEMWVLVTRGLGTARPTGNTLSQAFQTTAVSQGSTSKLLVNWKSWVPEKIRAERKAFR